MIQQRSSSTRTRTANAVFSGLLAPKHEFRIGGISNADKSDLKSNEVLYWSLHKQEYEYPAETVNLSVRFRVITEYCDPNYENNYPEEYTVLLDPISVKAEFGGTYNITITGDKENGYQASLGKP